MFKHFIGKIYLFEEPPKDKGTDLFLNISDDLLYSIDVEKFSSLLTDNQISKNKYFEDEMDLFLGKNEYSKLLKVSELNNFESLKIKSIAKIIFENKEEWSHIKYLNSKNFNEWDSTLYLIIKSFNFKTSISHGKFVIFIKILSFNWETSIPNQLNYFKKEKIDIDVDKFFELEKNITFAFSSLLNQVNIIQKIILNRNIDISPFITKMSYAFLPKLVYQLEEYGLPRMMSKKIQESGLITLENNDLSINEILVEFNSLGKELFLERMDLDPFEKYILDFFFEGIS